MILPVLAILSFASYKDIKTLEVPIPLSFMIEILSAISLGTNGSDLEFIIACFSAFVIFMITISAVVFGGLGGADCLMGTAIGLNLGLYGLYAFMFGLLFSIPYVLHLKHRHMKKDYPFIPYLTLGYIAAVIMMAMNGQSIIWVL